MTAAQHIVNVSGGKDSTACYLLALESGRPFRAVMADTGNEHPATIDYAQSLAARTGGPEVEIIRADFTERLDRRRVYVAEHWPRSGIPDAVVARAIEALQPTGIPFLDLCLWKGRFPSRKAQFCTEFLKSDPIGAEVIEPARRAGPVVQWLGVRRAESLNRRNAPMWQVVRTPSLHAMRYFRPLIHWTAENVLSYAAARGLATNPLYLQGMGRVGCFPKTVPSPAFARRSPFIRGFGPTHHALMAPNLGTAKKRPHAGMKEAMMIEAIGIAAIAIVVGWAVLVAALRGMGRLRWWSGAGLAAVIPMLAVAIPLALVAAGVAVWALT